MSDSIPLFDLENQYQSRLAKCQSSIEKFPFNDPYDFVNFYCVSFLDFTRLCEDLKLDSNYRYFRIKEYFDYQTSLNL